MMTMKSREDHEKFMKIAIEEARNSLKEGNKGFGAVLVKDGKIIAKAYDTEVTDLDPTTHAEMSVIRKVSKKYGKDLTGCVVISTHEPCAMCTGAIIWAKVSGIVYGVSIKDSKKLGRTMIDLSCKEIIRKSPWEVRVNGGILKKVCLKLYNDETRKWVKEIGAAKNTGWKGIEKQLLDKRIKWFEENRNMILDQLKGTDTEKAYQLILTKIGIDKDEAPIVRKTEKEIVFHSKNFCPVLEACEILALDTREVCKAVFEKPTEELIRKINPKLRFTRNYSCIRPYTPYCEEIITLET
jgi:tRNA(adenine34) deaminase